MRVLVRYLGIGMLVTTACGSGGSSKNGGLQNSNGRNSLTGQCTGSTSSQTCTGEDAYAQCLETACDAQLKTALGNGYASGSFSGPCAPYISCELACPCDATASACDNNCYMTDVTRNASCSVAFSAISVCSLGSGCTLPVCTANTTGAATSTATLINTATFTNTFTNTATLVNTSTLTSTATLTNTASGTNTATTNCAALLACCDALLAGPQAAAFQQTCSQLASLTDSVCQQVLAGWAQAGLCK